MTKKFRKPVTLSEIEAQSRRNAEAIVNRTSHLKSWGKSGYYRSKVNNKWMSYRSSIELNFYKIIDKPEKVQFFDAEIAIIPYMWKGAKLNYVPDLCVKAISGMTYIVEVKPKSQLLEARNQAKWTAAREWCFARNAKFLVVSEKNMKEISDKII